MSREERLEQLVDKKVDKKLIRRILKNAKKNPLKEEFSDFQINTLLGREMIALLKLGWLGDESEWNKIKNMYDLSKHYIGLNDEKMRDVLQALGYLGRIESSEENFTGKNEILMSYSHKLGDYGRLWVFSRTGKTSPLRLGKVDGSREDTDNEFVAVYKHFKKEYCKKSKETLIENKKTLILGKAEGNVSKTLKEIINASYGNSDTEKKEKNTIQKFINWYCHPINAMIFGAGTGALTAAALNPEAYSIAIGSVIGIAQAPIFAYGVNYANQFFKNLRLAKKVSGRISEEPLIGENAIYSLMLEYSKHLKEEGKAKYEKAGK